MATNLNADRCSSSMQLTRAADYAVRVMIFLASDACEDRAALGTIVRATGAPESFLSKVLQGLTRAGLITSRRGPTGGFEISPLGRLASVRDVVEAIDGPISLNVCVSVRPSCARIGWCPTHPVWAKAQRAVMDVLRNAMIADLASSGQEISPVAQADTVTRG
jgi:Rrf2 family protein